MSGKSADAELLRRFWDTRADEIIRSSLTPRNREGWVRYERTTLLATLAVSFVVSLVSVIVFVGFLLVLSFADGSPLDRLVAALAYAAIISFGIFAYLNRRTQRWLRRKYGVVNPRAWIVAESIWMSRRLAGGPRDGGTIRQFSLFALALRNYIREDRVGRALKRELGEILERRNSMIRMTLSYEPQNWLSFCFLKFGISVATCSGVLESAQEVLMVADFYGPENRFWPRLKDGLVTLPQSGLVVYLIFLIILAVLLQLIVRG